MPAYVPEVCLLKYKRTGFEAQLRHFMLNTLKWGGGFPRSAL